MDRGLPRERYRNDAQFKLLVDTMVGAIMRCEYTPSEMREAAVLACILYEELHVSKRISSSWPDLRGGGVSAAPPSPLPQK